MLVAILIQLMEKIDLLINEVRKKNELIFPEIMTAEQAANYLGVSHRYILDLKRTNRITFSQFGNIIRFRKSDLDEYLDNYKIRRR